VRRQATRTFKEQGMPATIPPELVPASSVAVGPSSENGATSAWLAAFALGLAYSERPDAERRAELTMVAGGCPAALRAARDRLVGTSVAEPTVQAQALALLAWAIVDSRNPAVRAPSTS
jgi:hypothetical protein